MKKNELMKNVSSTVSKATIRLKKHSPEFLVVAGVVGTVVSTVLACKATTKVGRVMDNAQNDIDEIHDAEKNGVTKAGETYSAEDTKKDLVIVYAQTGFKLAKLYAPSAALGALSITSIVASHNILKKRNAALAAVCASGAKAFDEYRSRVVERFGEDVDKELRHNIKAKKFEETVKDPESGREKKVKSTVAIAAPDINDYARFFDETCANYEPGNMDYNLAYLRAQQQYANERLRVEGYLFLSDVYEALGIKRTKMSQTVGWVYRPENPDGDNFVDFGIFETNRETEDRGYEKAILLEFNVDGPILDII